jgi:hypothetical protein
MLRFLIGLLIRLAALLCLIQYALERRKSKRKRYG